MTKKSWRSGFKGGRLAFWPALFLLAWMPILVTTADFQSSEKEIAVDHVQTAERSGNAQNMVLLANSPEFSDRYLGGVGGSSACVSQDGLALEACDSYYTGSTTPTGTEQTESIYVVKEGDTISQIAEMFGVTASTIIWANDLDGYIQEDQHLVILPFSGVRHQIQAGDTLSSIADHYDADLDEIKGYNGVSDDDLTVGNFLDVKGGVKPKPVEEKAPVPTQVAQRSPQVSGGAVQTAGYFVRPIRGGIRTQGLHGNNAVDLAAPYGTPIYAAASGRVVTSQGGWNSGYGNYIEIQHPNGTRTLYSHNSRNLVSVGQQVQQGQVIAEVGSSGLSTGPHVHFEVHGGVNPF